MAVRTLSSKAKILASPSLFFFISKPHSHSLSSSSSDRDLFFPHLVNDISRVLSDHRNPHHDLQTSLTPFTPHVSTTLVEHVLKRCKNLGFSAHRFFLWAKTTVPGFRPSKESYHILVDILGSSRQFALLWDFIREVRELDEGFESSPQLFWIVFRAYARAGLPGDAVRAFNRMVEFGVKPSLKDFDALLYVLCKRKHMNHAQEFFGKNKIEFGASVKSYSIMIRGWGDVGGVSEARKMFDEMTERGYDLDVAAYNSFLEALCKGGNVDEAYGVLQGMGSKGVAPDACSYSTFIRAYCEANDLHSALRVLDRMKRYDLVPNVFTYNCMIKKLCKNDKVVEAYQLLDEMIERGVTPDAWSYNAIQAYHCDHAEVNQATRLLTRMQKENCMPDRHSYNMVLKLLIRLGRFDRVEEVWNHMGEVGFYPSVSTYSVMVHGFCKKKGKLEEACRYFEMMIDEGIPPYIATVEMLRNRLMGLGFLDTIEVLASKMDCSTSCTVKDLATAMRGNRLPGGERREESEFESE